MALSDVLAIAGIIMLVLSVPVLVVVALLPHERRKKLLHSLGRKWIV
jgi:hypothetical protein